MSKTHFNNFKRLFEYKTCYYVVLKRERTFVDENDEKEKNNALTHKQIVSSYDYEKLGDLLLLYATSELFLIEPCLCHLISLQFLDLYIITIEILDVFVAILIMTLAITLFALSCHFPRRLL